MTYAVRQRGVALVAVLWVGLLLTIIAASVVRDIRVQAQTAHNLLETAKARAIAEAGIVLALEQLRERLRDRRIRAAAVRWLFAFGEGQVTVTVQDEGGKIDLNRAPEGLIHGLLVANEVEEATAAALTDAIADWRDRDDLRRPDGAEDRDYRRAGLAYGAKDRPFERVAEARRVLGMSADLYLRIAPTLTVYSGRRGIDPAVAPKEVLRAIPGVAESELNAAFEEIAGEEDGSARRQTLSSLFDGRAMISSSSRRAFSVRAEAHTNAGALYIREAIVRLVRRDGRPYQVLDWRIGRSSLKRGVTAANHQEIYGVRLDQKEAISSR